ncbi:hypothetical protein [Methylobacterium organophilum]|uniref:Lysozyme inhibitor LprI N-terminal domain-containing protein n=1 Tax=Methylobacterium organophilum TaxID=410 RepID=A0ABQ4T6B9_METOR|nr:hypothetical protein [Methylobacterium organophilum]UMY17202.1 hypothetical protein MMB17_21605 [Methylobacterium organophilum]GJE26768.1 hypothetical protein LKMONMHP_1619 [Methylobacterium organophilum]
MPFSLPRTALIALALLAAPAARAEGPAGAAGQSHAAWQSCLREAYGLKAALSGKTLAADAALRECRDRENAYLAALSTSPLLDDEDVARVRPALVARARIWLMGRAPTRQL